MSVPGRRAGSAFDRLAAIMAKLRDPDGGCPWDLEQDFHSIAPYTIEEAYEVADAIQRGAMDELRGELGDLLLQVVYHAEMAREAGLFDLHDVTEGIAAKMVRRHPHVFGTAEVAGAGAQTEAWEAMKAEERGAGALAGVAHALPALMRAQKLQRRAARVGFDWPNMDGPRAKIYEELAEVAAAIDADERRNEIGDVLFAVVNYARHLGIDAEDALRAASDKFERRFNTLEDETDTGLQGLTLVELEALWQRAKAAERRRR